MKKSPYLFLALLIISCIQKSNAQLTVTAGGTPAQIINAFVGSGLAVSNVVINCSPNAYGRFNGSTSNVGLSTGIMLTTGLATNAIGPNISDATSSCNGVTTVDPQLTAIEPLATWDLCVLEFDVVPHCPSMTLRFVFGSEEYPEYVNSQFNDVFGFFVTGPGPACQAGYYNNTNVAVLPNTTPVSINNINDGYSAACPAVLPGPCTNCAYYVNNCGCTSSNCIQYDGFTTPIDVTLNVCACGTYHWKFAIADAGDCAYDSGIFIESLTGCPPSLAYTLNTSSSHCNSCNGTAVANVTSGYPPYTYTWSPGGQTGATATGLCSGTAYTVTVSDANSCDNSLAQVFSIANIDSLTGSTSVQNISCNGDSTGWAAVSVNGGSAPYTYLWSPGNQTTATVSNLFAGNYTVSVTDSSGCTYTSVDSLSEPAVLTATSSVTNASCLTCCDGGANTVVNGGTGPYSYGATCNSTCPGVYVCCVTDANGCVACDTFTISYPTIIHEISALYSITISPNPAHSTFTISLNDQLSIVNCQLSIFDVTGRAVHEQTLKSKQETVHPVGQASYEVGCKLNAGIYFIKVRDGEKVYAQKLVIE